MEKDVYAVLFTNGFYYSTDGDMQYALNKAKLYDYEHEIGADEELQKFVEEKGLKYTTRKYQMTLRAID